jgi:uncharacterized protein YjiS (DUF1127 family)
MRGIWRLIAAIKHRREFRYLAGLDDRMLADIGLTRGDLDEAYLQPSWKDRTTMLASRVAERSASRSAASAARARKKGDP